MKLQNLIVVMLGCALTACSASVEEAQTEALRQAAYDPPIVITEGGSYTGNWQSLESDVPAVRIETSEAVVIENATIRGRGHLIAGQHLDLTVRNSYGYGLHPGETGRIPGRFVQGEYVHNIVLENNYFESTSGIYLYEFRGDPARGQTIKIVRNRAKNIDGRYSNGADSFSPTEFYRVCFVQLNSIQRVPDIEIAWNEVINEPYNSRVEDNINLYLSSGTPESPIRIHNNYIQGAYPAEVTTADYSGGGIMLGDGSSSTAEGAASFAHAYHNQMVGTSNYGIAIAAGHDNLIYENRVVASGLLQDGSYIKAQNVGIYIWDLYGDLEQTPPTFFNNVARDNLSGWPRQEADTGNWVRYGDFWFPDCATLEDGTSLCTSNQSLPEPITLESEAAEWTRWQEKVAGSGVVIGPGGSAYDIGTYEQ